jgi:uncharacterized membrane protein
VPNDWESHLERWLKEGVLDAGAGDRIREWESGQTQSQGLKWPILLALAFGALLVGAGVLLFVSAHWDQLSPAWRMFMVLLLVSVFHLGGAWAAGRFEGLSVALHAVGTSALGAGIALTGQIFNLQEHWPTAILMWAAGAVLAWALLRQWPQAALAAILIPCWLASEWWVRVSEDQTYFMAPVATGVCCLSFMYLSAVRRPGESAVRKALAWTGGLALLPAALATAAASWTKAPPWPQQLAAGAVVVLGSLAVALWLRGRAAIWNGVAILWTVMLALSNGGHGDRLVVYVWCAVGSVWLAAWGILESRAERINLGIAGFALTALLFYFSNVMDKLGRSVSLMGLGLLFLGGGWALERTRRRLLAQIREEAV